MLEEVDLRRLEEEGGSFSSPLVRVAAYRGAAREIGWMAFNAAVWPLGVVDGAFRVGAARVMRRARRNGHNGRAAEAGASRKKATEVPILLVHGYFHNHSGFLVMRRALRRQGFCNVRTFNYSPLRKGIPELAAEVGAAAERVIAECGSKSVHIVGHSLGGLLARYYVERLGGKKKVNTIVTLGTPHYGTLSAYLARSQTARQMRPGSDLLRELNGSPRPKSVRYLSYYSNLDALVVPSASAVLEDPSPNVKNILVHDLGHMSLLISAELISSISARLLEA